MTTSMIFVTLTDGAYNNTWLSEEKDSLRCLQWCGQKRGKDDDKVAKGTQVWMRKKLAEKFFDYIGDIQEIIMTRPNDQQRREDKNATYRVLIKINKLPYRVYRAEGDGFTHWTVLRHIGIKYSSSRFMHGIYWVKKQDIKPEVKVKVKVKVKADEVKADEVKADEVKADEVKADEVKALKVVKPIKLHFRPDKTTELLIPPKETCSESPQGSYFIPQPIAHIPQHKKLIKILVKPGQSGKTATINAHILKEFTENSTNHIMIIMSDKNLELVRQTHLRMQDDAKAGASWLKVMTLASKCQPGEGFKEVGPFIKNIESTDILVCCNHHARWDDIDTIMTHIAGINKRGRYYTMSVVIDECDVTSLSPLAISTIKSLLEFEYAKNVYMMTASPTERLVSTYGELELLEVSEPVHDTYVTLDNILHEEIPQLVHGYKYTAVGYVAAVLSTRSPCDGEIWFAPAEVNLESQYEMREMLFEHGFNIVIVLNGKEKTATIQPNLKVDICEHHLGVTPIKSWQNGSMELKDVIAKIHSMYPDLSIAITGNLCESRGITLQSASCMINYGIFSDTCATSQEAIYQLACRMLGPLKNFEAWKAGRRPTIICPTSFLKKAIQSENLVLNICKRSISQAPTLDLASFKEDKSRSIINELHTFENYLKKLHHRHAGTARLADPTVKEYCRTFKIHMGKLQDGVFTDKTIEEYKLQGNSTATSTVMIHFNTYINGYKKDHLH